MFKKILALFLAIIFFFVFYHAAYAADNPLSEPNNKIGIHILFPEELPAAAQLINSHGGDWGYVTIPIQSGDKDLVKWQSFMDQCAKIHVVPILRLATEGDFFNTKVWRKPNYNDIVDFSNFLDSLSWPTKNRYIIVFNEVNRADEWGGSVNPAEYADILNFAYVQFKSRNPDYFIINAGLDNAAPQSPDQYMNEYNFLRAMNDAVPGIFGQIDGMASHSYPNPGFSQPPDGSSMTGVDSFHFEQQLVESFSNKDLPIFITETGWSSDAVSDDMRAQYLQDTLSSFWNDKDIVAITPFLLNAGGGPFAQFSFIAQNGSYTKQYQTLSTFPKIKGSPSFPPKAFAKTNDIASTLPLESKNFSHEPAQKNFHVTRVAQDAFNFLFNL